MGDKVSPGDPFRPRAVFWNGLVDVYDAYQRRPAALAEASLVAPDFLKCKIRNDSDADVPRYGVLAITEVLFTRTDNEEEFLGNWAFKGDKPTWPTDKGSFVICPTGIIQGQIGDGIMVGHTPCKVYVVSESHWWADVETDSVTRLRSRPGGSAQILWKASGTGEKDAIVRFGHTTGQPIIAIGKADAAKIYTQKQTTMQSVTVSEFQILSGGSSEADTSANITAYDWCHQGCFKNEPLILIKLPFDETDRWYWISTKTSCLVKGVVPGGTTTTPGSATVDLWEINSSGNYADTTDDITALNTTPDDTSSGVILQAKKVNGMVFIDVDNCGTLDAGIEIGI